MAGAPKGNKNAKKLKTPELREKAYEQYCAHLAKGKSSRSFTFVEGDLMLTGKSMENYINDNPIDFPIIKKEIAFAQGFAYWEEIVENTGKGIDKNASLPALQMIMRNKYDWDKEDKSKESTNEPLVRKLFEAISKT